MRNDHEDAQDNDWDDMGEDEDNAEGWEAAGADETKTEVVAEPEVAAGPAVETDPEDPVQFPEQFYDVQTEYEADGATVAAGSSVLIKCSNCAAWEAPLLARGGKPLCRPGRSFTLPAKKGEDPRQWRMQEDRYSCQKHFIPKDMENLLPLLTDDLGQVRMLVWAFPVITKFVQLQQRIQVHHSKFGGDAEKSINAAIDFIMLFSSDQQQKLVKPFVKSVIEGLATRKKATTSAKSKAIFRTGDHVSWEVQPGKTVEGYILSIGGRTKLVTIMVSPPFAEILSPGSTQPFRWQRFVSDWRTMKPRKLASTLIDNGSMND